MPPVRFFWGGINGKAGKRVLQFLGVPGGFGEFLRGLGSKGLGEGGRPSVMLRLRRFSSYG